MGITRKANKKINRLQKFLIKIKFTKNEIIDIIKTKIKKEFLFLNTINIRKNKNLVYQNRSNRIKKVAYLILGIRINLLIKEWLI